MPGYKEKPRRATYSLEQKYDYNLSNNGEFGLGYCSGVDKYRDYGFASESQKKKTREFIDEARQYAKANDYWKGVMCGYRDAANDRKGRK